MAKKTKTRFKDIETIDFYNLLCSEYGVPAFDTLFEIQSLCDRYNRENAGAIEEDSLGEAFWMMSVKKYLGMIRTQFEDCSYAPEENYKDEIKQIDILLKKWGR